MIVHLFLHNCEVPSKSLQEMNVIKNPSSVLICIMKITHFTLTSKAVVTGVDVRFQKWPDIMSDHIGSWSDMV